MDEAPKKAGRNYWLAGIIAMFALFIAGDIVLIIIATGNPSELVEDDPYEKGLKYDEIQRQMEATKALGWKLADRDCPEGAGVCLALTDGYGAPVSGAAGAVSFLRPSDSRLDFHAKLFPTSSTGVFSLEREPSAGFWKLVANVSRGGDAARFTLDLLRP